MPNPDVVNVLPPQPGDIWKDLDPRGGPTFVVERVEADVHPPALTFVVPTASGPAGFCSTGSAPTMDTGPATRSCRELRT